MHLDSGHFRTCPFLIPTSTYVIYKCFAYFKYEKSQTTNRNIPVHLIQSLPFKSFQFSTAFIPVPEGGGSDIQDVHQVFLPLYQFSNDAVPLNIKTLPVGIKVKNAEAVNIWLFILKIFGQQFSAEKSGGKSVHNAVPNNILTDAYESNFLKVCYYSRDRERKKKLLGLTLTLLL